MAYLFSDTLPFFRVCLVRKKKIISDKMDYFKLIHNQTKNVLFVSNIKTVLLYLPKFVYFY